MKCVIGPAAQVRHGWEWAGDGGVFSATTDLVVGELHVRINTATRSKINEGDRVAVSGTVRDQTLKALAYKNLSTESDGDARGATSLFIGVALLVMTIAVCSGSTLVALLSAAMATIFLVHGYRTHAAVRAIEDAA